MKSKTPTLRTRCMRVFGKVTGQLATFPYHEQFKRTTLQPMIEIIRHQEEPELQQRLLRQWAQTKIREASYIQLAGGLLFTTVASCLQWPSVEDGHWSARACFYASLLLAFVAIVMGSQQMLLLPSQYLPGDPNGSHERAEALDPKNRYDQELKFKDDQYSHAVVKRLCDTSRDDGAPNSILLFAMQTPEMLLSGSVMTFLAGVCSVVFAPLAAELVWDENAKVMPDPLGVSFWDIWLIPGYFSDCFVLRHSRSVLHRGFRNDIFPEPFALQSARGPQVKDALVGPKPLSLNDCPILDRKGLSYLRLPTRT
ncbi:MAG: hypothetical protein Q9176_006526 [Flavoplaca citrina]